MEIVGQPDDEGLWRLYEESHVLVAPSQHEGLCVPVLEAYHAGCRVIGSDAGNLPFIVQPPDPVFPVNDVRALSAAIESVAARRARRRDRRRRPEVAELLQRYSAASARERLRSATAVAACPVTSTHTSRVGSDMSEASARHGCSTCSPARSATVALTLADVRHAHGLVWDARLECAEHGLVGVVMDTKPSFLDRDFARADHRHQGFKRDVARAAAR